MPTRTWTADNGDGTYTNPLFYEEFSDPDIIRVGEDFYLTGTTMHTMPGLPVLHSRDLVNWELLSYAFDRLDLGPEFRLEGGEIYGQGIWAPCLRYHAGTFYIFSNINGQKTQIFTATDPRGPWFRQEAEYSFHDLSVLFDDDGRVYVVYGYRNVKLAQLDESLTRVLPGTERDITPPDSLMGEGGHIYKIGGRYFIISAWFAGHMRMPAARADHIDGPWEVNPAISIDEDFGLAEGHKIRGATYPLGLEPPFEILPPVKANSGRLNLHQGGIVDTPAGEWWGWSMMDYNALGRLTALSPITWQDGWPYFGLPGNLGRTPRTWVKPKTATPEPIHAPWQRNDDFEGPALNPIWQWNHVPVEDRWSLTESPGHLRLRTQPAENYWWAKNSLTQRAIGPVSEAVAKLDGSGLVEGDIAGLALLGLPWRWIGLQRSGDDWKVVTFDVQTSKRIERPLPGPQLWLKASCDFLTEIASFSYSSDGIDFVSLGEEAVMVYQLKTFQGIRYALFAYNETGVEGGHADFDGFEVIEPHPRGLMQPIPAGQSGRLVRADDQDTGLSLELGSIIAGQPMTLSVELLELGRVRLRSGSSVISVTASGVMTLSGLQDEAAKTFQWMETPTGEVVLMSLSTNRFVRLAPNGLARADSPGPAADGMDGARFRWVQQP